MPSTYLSLYYHIIFATKNRAPLITAAWRERMHEFLGGIVNGKDAQSLCVGGVDDHVHLLVRLTANHRLADFMRELKKVSSTWAGERIPGFAWQEGYAALTVSASAVEEVRTYIRNQEQHHRSMSFRDEVLSLLRKSGVEVDERYFD
jgi:REP element-mobilizing transposase RayT